MAKAKWRRIRINIPQTLGPEAREAIGIQLRNEMIARAQRGMGVGPDGKTSKKFPGYTKKYRDFKASQGLATSPVNLTFDADMLNALDLISHRKGSVLIGFENGTEENAKAEGNIIGSYGKPKPNPAKARNFLGLPDSVKQRIIRQNRDAVRVDKNE